MQTAVNQASKGRESEVKVYGEGKKESKIWLLGEAPGAQEDATGKPFIGGAGRVLDGLLGEAGIVRGETYIDNVIQDRPPKNDFSIHYKDKGRKEPKQLLIDNHERVRGEVSKYRPNVVVALGGEALYALTGKTKIMNWRGSILDCGGVKVIPTIHPASVMRQFELKPIALLDLNRVKQESLSPLPPPPYPDMFLINPTFSQVMEYIDILHTKEYLSFDIETAGDQITCIGFGWSNHESICIPICYSTNSWWTNEEENHIIIRLRGLFLNPNIKFIAQNAQYDMIWLGDKWGIEVKNLWMDTMIAFHCVYPELLKRLAFLCSIYTNRPYYKDPGKTPNELWHYNCLDTVVTWEVAHAIQEELKEFGTYTFYNTHSHLLIKPLIKMQRRGVKIDLKKREEIDKSLEEGLKEMHEKLNKVVGKDLNPNSPKQMKEFLYEDLKLPKQYGWGTFQGKRAKVLSTDEDAIETLQKLTNNPVLKLVLDIRKAGKLLGTYIRAPLDPDGRMRCSYRITGTETGRLASSKSVYRTGTNLQNVPRGPLVRGMFIPDEGMKFVAPDLSQAEARVVAYLAQDKKLQSIFEVNNGDVHKYNAAVFFKKRMEDITGGERDIAKTLVHASNYKIGPKTFAKEIGVSVDRAQALLNQYYASYPRIKMWHREVEEELRKTRILTTPLGRRRMFFGRWSPELVRDATAYIPQSTISDILNMGIVRASNNLPQGWEMLLQQHDGVVFQLPKTTDGMHILKYMKHYFEIPVKIHGEELVVPVEVKVGDDWGNMKKLEV